MSFASRLLAGMPLEDKDSVLTYSYAVEGIGGFTLLLSQPRVFTGEMTRLMLVVGCSLGALSLALCLWGALVLSRQLTRPVQEMTAAMKRVQLGQLSVRVTPRGMMSWLSWRLALTAWLRNANRTSSVRLRGRRS